MIRYNQNDRHVQQRVLLTGDEERQHRVRT